MTPGTGSVPHVFVVDLDRPVLDPADRHHLERARRVRPGALVTVTDGAGRWRVCRFGDDLEVLGEVHAEPSGEPLGVAFALTKGHKPELVVQKLTELGIDVVVPFVASRSVVRWADDAARRQVERWRRVAREAAMQCGRCRLPRIDDLRTLPDLAIPSDAGFAVAGAAPLDRGVRMLFVGPEGGWAPDELARAPRTVGLGPHVLRAETAAIVAGALLVDRRGGA